MPVSVSVCVLFYGISVTAYRSVPDQTDSTPYVTSTGETVHHGGAAISRDLLCPACRRHHARCASPVRIDKLHYGDVVSVPGAGWYAINDAMGEYVTKTIGGRKTRVVQTMGLDIWVNSKKKEADIARRFGGKKVVITKLFIGGKYVAQRPKTVSKTILRRMR